MIVVHVISMSGGKDSTATALLALERHPRDSLRFVFADTGNEHPMTYAYLDYLEGRIGIKIERLRRSFDAEIAHRRLFVANDQRVGRKNGKKVRHTNKAKRRILAALKPTGNPYLDLCLVKGRFPSRRAQFCTQFLKTEPLVEYQMALIDQGYEVVSWQGVRRDESANRRHVLAIEEAGGGLWNYRPIADWTAEQVFEFHISHGVVPNALYKLGMTRVGCMPCINASKAEIAEIAARFPEVIEQKAEWERMVALASKRCGASYFRNTDDDPVDKSDIRKVVRWAKTRRAGDIRQDTFEFEAPACSSAYGLCE